MNVQSLAFAAALVAASAGALAVLPAGAQNLDVIKQRQEAMKNIGGAAKAAGQMLKGEVAFDAAKAAAVFTVMASNAKEFGTHFPEDSKTGGKTEAAPAIWTKPEEFKAELAKFEGDIAAAAATKPESLDAFKPAFASVAQNCKGCHEEFRVDN
ncbi:cytochrome c-556 [Aureimonas sp. SA4125]|uniref:c-type cytochrome n=1 Tax=Aureimonas sp. SA4125 TaxID=2826993 RepID=UPI001CC566E7|nr:cytochrome c [Aureimonas sp. SA4125]BDA85994.1 cytochrome c-556 [Aureimonas sp. SA4125]